MTDATPHDAPDGGEPPSAKPKRTPSATIVVAALCTVAAFVAGRALSPPTPIPVVERARDTAAGDRRVTMSAALARRAGVRAEPCAEHALVPTVELVGTVEFDRDRLAEVGGRIGGRITRIHVRPGARVSAGDPIAEIESAELGDATAQYLSATARSIAARAEAARAERLASASLATARDREQARADRDAISAEIRGARARLIAMGVLPNELSRGSAVTLRAPIDGWIVDRPALLGESVERTQTVARVADLRSLWVELEVFEKDIGRVRRGNHAELTTDSQPGRTFSGLVDHVAETVDRDSRTAAVRIVVNNPELLLRPGMFVTARLRLDGASSLADGGALPRSITIARTAVVQLDGRPAVFVALGGDDYEPRAIELGVVDGERIEVTRGLTAGERVVVEGAFALKSELLR
ncbi:MAG: efflux RND transporter periplasmic adaptor subunit [Myxococcales bacterium]|nr:efflux RND transporter periplasmic adaptor subunit [Myxococcales bacterium]